MAREFVDFYLMTAGVYLMNCIIVIHVQMVEKLLLGKINFEMEIERITNFADLGYTIVE